MLRTTRYLTLLSFLLGLPVSVQAAGRLRLGGSIEQGVVYDANLTLVNGVVPEPGTYLVTRPTLTLSAPFSSFGARVSYSGTYYGFLTEAALPAGTAVPDPKFLHDAEVELRSIVSRHLIAEVRDRVHTAPLNFAGPEDNPLNLVQLNTVTGSLLYGASLSAKSQLELRPSVSRVDYTDRHAAEISQFDLNGDGDMNDILSTAFTSPAIQGAVTTNPNRKVAIRTQASAALRYYDDVRRADHWIFESTVGVTGGPGSRLVGHAEVGAQHFATRAGNEQTGVVLGLGLTYRVSGRLEADASYAYRRVVDVVGAPTAVGQGRLAASFGPVPRVRLHTAVFLAHAEQTSGALDLSGADLFYSLQLGVSYDILRNLTGTLNGAFQENIGTPEGNDFGGARVSFLIRYTF